MKSYQRRGSISTVSSTKKARRTTGDRMSAQQEVCFGILQRWMDYLLNNKENVRHARAARQPGRQINLRCLAHYGHELESWCLALAEGVFQVYLGTVDDPGPHAHTERTKRFLNDSLYVAIEVLRSFCALDKPVVKGLNSTWTLVQGWRGPSLKVGTKCVDCTRTVLAGTDSLFHRSQWQYADSSRPAGDELRCNNCDIYRKKYGQARPAFLETARVERAAAITILHPFTADGSDKFTESHLDLLYS